jgi:hypothetical protein
MITDITKPNVSAVSQGTMGKNTLIYGDGGTGKTSNAIQAPDTLVLGFEQGLGGLTGVRYFLMQSWTDFQQAVKLLTLAAANVSQPLPYKTVVVDGIDRMGILAKKYISNLHGANNFSEVGGDARYSIWDEFKAEIDIQIMALINSPYSMIWIDHSTVVKDHDAAGQEISVIAPSGDDRVVDKIYDQCDICAYAQAQPNTVDGQEVHSTLFLRAGNQVRVKSRFQYIVPFIPEWTYAKFAKAIDDAIALEAKQTGVKAVAEETKAEDTRKAVEAKVADASKDATATVDAPTVAPRPIKELVLGIHNMLVDMEGKTGDKTHGIYMKYLADVLGDPNFRCSQATEADRAKVESIYAYLEKNGYRVNNPFVSPTPAK